jgi:hypothetical protein
MDQPLFILRRSRMIPVLPLSPVLSGALVVASLSIVYPPTPLVGQSTEVEHALLAQQGTAEAPVTCGGPFQTVPWTGLSSYGADVLRIAEIRGRTTTPALRALRRGAHEGDVMMCGFQLPGLRDASPPVPVNKPSWRLIPVRLRSISNSAYPVDRANGPMRGGKGASAGLIAGATVRYGPVTAQLAPFVGWEQNGDFTILERPSNRSIYANPWIAGIDWPQRFGSQSAAILDPGESFVRADVGPLGVGLSTETVTWGGARRYPILLGDAAPGFPHLFMGTSTPLSVGIGDLDIQLISAALRESDYFNEDPADDGRRLTGFFGSFHPGGVRGLTLGVSGILVSSDESDQTVFDLLRNPLQFGENPDGNGIYSFFFRWVLEDSGFELYAEWARDDATRDIEDFIGAIDHSSAWTAGFQKTDQTSQGLVRVGFEMTDIKSRRTSVDGRNGLRFFTHGGVVQGHTNDGQLLGTWTGPGSDAQFLEIDLFRDASRFGIFMERVRRDEETFEQVIAFDYGFRGHDAEFVGGVRASYAWHDWLIDGTASLSHRKNRSFIGLDGVNFDFLRENNLSVDVTVSWWPQSMGAWRPF